MVEPREIVSSRAKLLGLFGLSLGFVAIAAFLPDNGGDWTWRWLCGGFFGLCAAILAVSLVRPQRLLLDAAGFSVTGGLARQPRRVAWADMTGFFLHQLPRGGPMIGYNFTDRARPDTYMGDLAKKLGVDGAIPKTLPGSPEHIVADLNAYRAAALAD